jgi:hypothetical protein
MIEYFGQPMQAGKSIGAQPGLADKINAVTEVLQNFEGVGDIVITRNGTQWRIGLRPQTPWSSGGGGGDLTGYTEKEDAIIDARWNYGGNGKIEIKRGTVLVKDDTETDWAELVSTEAYSV